MDLKDRHMIELLEQACMETHENNVLLRQIVKFLNTFIARHHQENNDDFNRNVMAHLLSNLLDGKTVRGLR